MHSLFFSHSLVDKKILGKKINQSFFMRHFDVIKKKILSTSKISCEHSFDMQHNTFFLANKEIVIKKTFV